MAEQKRPKDVGGDSPASKIAKEQRMAHAGEGRQRVKGDRDPQQPE